MLGWGTLVVLLNARLSLIYNFGSDENKECYENDFESVFYLSVAPQEVAPGCLMQRLYPKGWIITGSPKTIATFDDKPTKDQCLEAYDKLFFIATSILR